MPDTFDEQYLDEDLHVTGVDAIKERVLKAPVAVLSPSQPTALRTVILLVILAACATQVAQPWGIVAAVAIVLLALDFAAREQKRTANRP